MRDEDKTRKQLILELRELRAAAGSVNDLIVIADRHGRPLKVLAGKDGLSKSPGAAAGKTFHEAVLDAPASSFVRGIRKTLRTGRTVHIEERRETEEGELWFSLTLSPMTRDCAVCAVCDITGLKKAQKALKIQSAALEEANTALKVLLKKAEEVRREVEENIVSNMRMLVMPYIEKMGRLEMGRLQRRYLNVIETNLRNIALPFLRGLSEFNLTPTEIQVANYIRDGKTTKEIMALLHASKGAIDTHRYNIRKKLGINNAKVNLRSHLLALR